MKYNHLFIFVSMLVLSSCGKLSKENPIPLTKVDFALNMMQEAPMLNVQGGFYEMTEPKKYGQYIGYGGVVVFHTFDDYFVAFDMSCPHEADMNIKVRCNMAGQAICDSCKSVYDVGFGSGYPVQGTSQYPLRKYRVYPAGYELHVTN